MTLSSLVAECRIIIEKSKKKKASVDERPEMDVGSSALPRRGVEKTAPYGGGSRSTISYGSGSHGQSSHT